MEGYCPFFVPGHDTAGGVATRTVCIRARLGGNVRNSVPQRECAPRTWALHARLVSSWPQAATSVLCRDMVELGQGD